MNLPQTSHNPVHVLLVLGRVSNLPTVWSNCVAAWLLGGGGSWQRFVLLCAGATLLYTGGMFLNDAFDTDFDRQHRRERPIPSGRISRRSVWFWGASLLAMGLISIIPLGLKSSMFGVALVICIVIYDAVHKRLSLSPVLMSACRLLLYLVAASSAQDGVSGDVVWRALALASYVSGLSFLARLENFEQAPSRWSIVPLFVPIALSFLIGVTGGALAWLALGITAAWISWCVRGVLSQSKRNLGRGVSGLLAGIILVDLLAVAVCGLTTGLVLFGLFLLALILQRFAPAT